jgi:hypothetical protein
LIIRHLEAAGTFNYRGRRDVKQVREYPILPSCRNHSLKLVVLDIIAIICSLHPSAGSLIYTTLSQFPELVAALVGFSYKIIFLLYQTHYLFLTAFSHSLTSKVPVSYHPPFSPGKR